jgi:hypothetical protein
MLLLEHATTPYPRLFHCAICEGHVHSGKYSWLQSGTIKLLFMLKEEARCLKEEKEYYQKFLA